MKKKRPIVWRTCPKYLEYGGIQAVFYYSNSKKVKYKFEILIKGDVKKFRGLFFENLILAEENAKLAMLLLAKNDKPKGKVMSKAYNDGMP